ncbi:metallophosphoesterase [Kineococcus terrestris]|uniref:metallophosphoesterase n=1 Tax=Kineococcus terrestris TaxID=2044856 RepID=UPI0034DB3EE4
MPATPRPAARAGARRGAARRELAARTARAGAALRSHRAGRAGLRTARVLAPWLAVLLVAAAGAGTGFALAPGSTTYVGPLQTEVRVQPSLSPGVEVDLPPVGKVEFDTHTAPVLVTANIRSVDLDAASRLVTSPQELLALELTVADTVRAATVRAAAWSVGCGLAGALLGGLLVFRALRRTLQTGAACLVAVVATAGGAAATFDPAGLQQPRFTGLLSRAPYLVTSTQDALERLESYRSGLSDIVRSVSTLYAVSADLPVLGDGTVSPGAGADVTTVLHISDLHLNPLGFDLADDLVDQFGVEAVVDTGDITTWGTGLESSFLDRIPGLGVPYVFVRGNHDSAATQAAVAAQPGAVVLDEGETAEVAGLRFAGNGDPVFTPSGDEGGEGQEATGDAEAVQRAGHQVLADRIVAWEGSHADDPVDVALVHDPSGTEPLLGRVPLVLAGHLHSRRISLDASGTRVMVQGTTGGSGISAAGLARLAAGTPVPLSATLLYFAASGERAGRLVAYDEVTVGGLGLAEVSLQRTVVPPEEDRPLVVPTDLPTGEVTDLPTGEPTDVPTGIPTDLLTEEPGDAPGDAPADTPGELAGLAGPAPGRGAGGVP